MLKDAILPAWNSGLLEGVRLTGATGWMPANKDLSNSKLQGADLSSCDLSSVDLSGADLRGANLSNANMKSANLTNSKLHNALLPPWSSGLMEGVKLAGAEGWVPADKDLSNAKLQGADLSSCDFIRGGKLNDAPLPDSNSGLLEVVQGRRGRCRGGGVGAGASAAGTCFTCCFTYVLLTCFTYGASSEAVSEELPRVVVLLDEEIGRLQAQDQHDLDSVAKLKVGKSEAYADVC
jgi:hypothetical protein